MARRSLAGWGLVAIVSLCLLAGCASWPCASGDQRIHHIVICWLNDPEDAAARAELIAAGDELRQIPGVIELQVGTPLNASRPGVDSSYDVIFTMTFASNAAYTTYLGHPTHQRLVREVLEPNVDRFAVYDFQPKSAQ